MTRQHVRNLAASLAILLIVAGVPILLYGLGGGLPSRVPNAHQAKSFLGRPLADSDLLRGLSLICWAVWALFVVALAAEAVAWARHRPGPSLTRQGFRIPGLQGAAGSLFLAAVVLLPHRPAAATAPIANSGMSSQAQISTVGQPPMSVLPEATSLVQATPGTGRIPYVVQHGETLWGIAEAHVGNGLAWRQITDFDGRTFDTGAEDWVQVNGRMIYEREARLIFSGETVYLPASWSATQSAPLPHPVKDPPSTLQQSAVEHPLHLPPDPGPLAPITPSSAASPLASSTDDHTVKTAAGSHHDSPIEIVALLGAGMVSGAVLSTLNRMRARQSRYRRPGRRIRLPQTDLASTERELRTVERSDLTSATHRALRAFATDLRRQNSVAPAICAVIAGEDRIEVLLDRPGEAPTPWETSHDGYRWSLAAEHISAGLEGGTEPLPCLIPIGRVPDSTAEVMLNLAAARVVHVRGDPEHAAGLIHAAALAFTGLPWTESADVVLIGSDPTLAEAAVQIRAVRSLDEVIDDLDAQVIDLREAFGEQLNSGIDRPEGWLPTVVLLGQEDNGSESLGRLTSLCTSGSGIYAMVVSPGDGPGWTLDVDSTPAVIPELRLAVEPFCAPPEWAGAIRQLVALANDTADVGVDDPPYDQLESGERTAARAPVETSPPVVATTAADGSESADVPARINVLGPVTFEGVENFLRPRSFEIALYLAMHRDGVSESQLDEMIWPSKAEVPRSTRDQAVSAARTALGGRSRFPLAQGQGWDKTYRLSDQVRTDWSEFCALYRDGHRTKSVELLRAALQLVRGRPFGDLDAGPGFRWLHTEGHVRHMEAEIVDVADLASGLYLDRGEPLEARWAATQGLLAGPSERLWVRLMAAADALGEAQEIERLLAEVDTQLGLDGDFSQLHPDTISAYRLYSRQRTSPKP